MIKLKEVKISENESTIINPSYSKYDSDDRDAFRYIKRKKGAKVWRLECGHFVDSVTLFGNEKKCYCPLCNKENPEPTEIKEISTTNSYLCWDCQSHWIADIPSKRHHWGEDKIQCPNCGAINIIKKKRIFPNNWGSLRHECFKRDNYTCVECGKKPPQVVLHCDHIISKDDGGTDELDNLQTLCEECNLSKSNSSWKTIAPRSNSSEQSSSSQSEDLICVKEDLLRKSQNSLTRTSLNADINRNNNRCLTR
jgi:DNA-directed RNA polymerase subunit RPC12/RpoP